MHFLRRSHRSSMHCTQASRSARRNQHENGTSAIGAARRTRNAHRCVRCVECATGAVEVMTRVALLWRGDPRAVPALAENNRLRPVFDALNRRGVETIAAVYTDEVVDDVRNRLDTGDGVLVWVDPITDGRDRSRLDPMLREVAARGVWVSAHPDVILK